MEFSDIVQTIDSLGTLGLLIVVLYAFWSGNLLSKKVYDELICSRDYKLLDKIEKLIQQNGK